MTRFALAAAGTGGHVYPALRVADELVRQGVPAGDVVFFGGSRMEADAVPGAGYELVQLPLQGLVRSLTPRNLRIPFRLASAVRRARAVLRDRAARVLLAFGGYVTIPTAFAAHRLGLPVFLQEQNAVAGLANRVAARWAHRVYLGFPTANLAGQVVGNPLPPVLDDFDRAALRRAAQVRYDVPDGRFVLGVAGGSLGARAVNDAVADLATGWDGPPLAVVHLAGRDHAAGLAARVRDAAPTWRVLPFETDMQYFYAVADLVVARSSGLTTSELAATGTPALLVPRAVTRAGHYEANATDLADAGGAEVVTEDQLAELPGRVAALAADPARLAQMAAAASARGRRGAASRIAADLIEAAGD